MSRKISEFRSLLSTARETYAKGRSFDAADLQKQALSFGSKNLPRFEDSSLVKAHALLELGLATSAICTDFAQGKEFEEKCQETQQVLNEALEIYHHRLSNGTLTKWRKEEVWLKGKNSYESPVPHTERLGPVDFLTCTNMACGFHAAPESVASLKKALSFARQFKANKCIIHMEVGGALEGQLPGDAVLEQLRTSLRHHEQELAGVAVERENNVDIRQELRHTGTRMGNMKLSHEKIAKDVKKKGLRKCGHVECTNMERQPREFATCSKCRWVAYCCKDHQVADWPLHKKICKTVALEQKREYKERRKADHTLNPGEAQNFLTIVAHMHHYFIQSPQVRPLMNMTSPGIVEKLKSAEDHRSLSMSEIDVIWNCFWSMPSEQKVELLEEFVDEMKSYGFPAATMGGPDFSVVLDWNQHAIVGLFAVVKHTSKGSILLHEEGPSVHAYQVIGITDNLETMLSTLPLPVYIGTTLLPFKGLIVTQGTMVAGVCKPSLETAADAYLSGDETKVITDLLQLNK